MYRTSVKSNVDGFTHTDEIIKMLKSTRYISELDHSENGTHSLWFTKLTTTSRPSYSATHPDPTHVILIVTEQKTLLSRRCRAMIVKFGHGI